MNIPLLITSAVNVIAPITLISNQETRLNATIKAIIKLRELFSGEIVVCDGSGFDLSPHLSGISGVFEVIYFENNYEMVAKRGKGFGEGEIVKYALENSSILKSRTAFAKCTSKLWVDNIDMCIDSFNGQSQFMTMPIFGLARYVDTRFYIVSIEFYKNNIVDAYKDVNDHQGHYLEHCFYEKLKHFRADSILCKIPPEIHGLSGTSGTFYRPALWKRKFKQFRNSLFRFFNIF